MIQAYLYVHRDKSDTEAIKKMVTAFQGEFPHIITIIDIDSDAYLASEYDQKAPVLDIGPYRLLSPFAEDEIAFAFIETQKKLDRAEEKGDRIVLERFTQAPKMTGSDKFSFLRLTAVVTNGMSKSSIFLSPNISSNIFDIPETPSNEGLSSGLRLNDRAVFMFLAALSISWVEKPAANTDPTSPPALVPATPHILKPFSCRQRMTPMCAIPRTPPPPNAITISIIKCPLLSLSS